MSQIKSSAERAKESPLTWFDGHLDLTYIADHGRDLMQAAPADSASGGVSFPGLAAANVRAVISTIFVRKRILGSVDGPYCFDEGNDEEAHRAALRQVSMHDTWAQQGLLFPLGDKRESPLQFALAIEGAACIETPDQLERFHQWGVRMVALTWAEGSRYAGGDQGGGDVTPAGLKLLEQLDALKCVHDVSHLSERAFWTVLERAKGTKVASHSNCRALLPGAKNPQRHLSDEQIKAIASAGGVIGVNLFARFLVPPDEWNTRRATTADVVRHMNHIAEVAGTRDCLALGSDMDSGFGPVLLPVDLQRPQDLPRLAEALSQANWSDDQIRRFAKRWYDVLPVNPD